MAHHFSTNSLRFGRYCNGPMALMRWPHAFENGNLYSRFEAQRVRGVNVMTDHKRLIFQFAPVLGGLFFIEYFVNFCILLVNRPFKWIFILFWVRCSWQHPIPINYSRDMGIGNLQWFYRSSLYFRNLVRYWRAPENWDCVRTGIRGDWNILWCVMGHIIGKDPHPM